MEESKKERLSGSLAALAGAGGIEGAAVITRDGLLIVSNLADNVDAETFAAMSAAMMGAAETAVSELGKEAPERVVIESRRTKLLCAGAGKEAILVVVARPDTNLGLVLVSLKKTAAKIEAELE